MVPVRMRVASLFTLSQTHWECSTCYTCFPLYLLPSLSYCGVYMDMAPSLQCNGRVSNLVSITTAVTSSFRSAVLVILRLLQ